MRPRSWRTSTSCAGALARTPACEVSRRRNLGLRRSCSSPWFPRDARQRPSAVFRLAAKLTADRMLVKNVSDRRQMSRDVTNDTGARVGELVRQHQAGLSPAERKLARVPLAPHPIAGLDSIARFAEHPGVRPASVPRFTTSAGFRGSPE